MSVGTSRLLGMGAVALFRATGVLLQLVVIVVIAWKLSSAEAGSYFLAFSAIQITSAFARLGLDQSLVRNVPAWHEQRREGTILRALLVAQSLALAMALFAATTVGFVLEPHVRIAFVLAVAALVSMTLVLSVVQALGMGGWFALLRDVAQPGLLLVGVIALADSATSAVILLVVSCVLTTALALARLLPALRLRGVLGARSLDGFVRQAVPLWGASLLTQASRWVDTFLLGLLAGPEILAVYTPLSRAAALVSFPLSVVNVRFPPRAAFLYARRRMDELTRLARSATALSVAASTVLLLSVAPILDLGVRTIAPGAVAPGALLAFVILLAGQFANAAAGPAGFLLMMTRKEVHEAWSLGAGILAFGLLAAFTVPMFGLIGAAIAGAATHVVTNAARVFAIQRAHGIVMTSGGHALALAAMVSYGVATWATGFRAWPSLVVAVGFLIALIVTLVRNALSHAANDSSTLESVET